MFKTGYAILRKQNGKVENENYNLNDIVNFLIQKKSIKLKFLKFRNLYLK